MLFLNDPEGLTNPVFKIFCM